MANSPTISLTIIAMVIYISSKFPLYFCSIVRYSFGIDAYTLRVYLSSKFIMSISAASPIIALYFFLTHIPVPYPLVPIHSISNSILRTTSFEPRVYLPAKSLIHFYYELYFRFFIIFTNLKRQYLAHYWPCKVLVAFIRFLFSFCVF